MPEIKPRVFEHCVDVRQSDFDQYGHVAAVRYLDYVFTSRWMYSEKLGLGLNHTMEKGIIFPVIRSEVNYKREITSVGQVFVRSWVSELDRAKFWVQFEILSNAGPDATLYSNGQFLCVSCDLKTRKPVAVPDWILSLVMTKES